MILKKKKAQAAIEMILIMAAVAVLVAPMVIFSFRKYMQDFGGSLQANLQAQIRYGVSEKTNGLAQSSLGKKDQEALPYNNRDQNSTHPFAAVAPGWSN